MSDLIQTLVRGALQRGGETPAGAVRAALPSKFETTHTLDTDRPPAQDTTLLRAAQPTPIAPPGSIVSRSRDLARSQTPTTKPDVDHRLPAPVINVTAESALHIRNEDRSSRTATSSPVQQSSLPARLVRVDVGSDDEQSTVDARPVVLTSSVVSPNVSSRPLHAAPDIKERRVTSGPLSEPALAGIPRTQRAEQRIVHVTIDRLEVRAPAKATVTSAGRKERTKASSASLSDYLRGRSG